MIQALFFAIQWVAIMFLRFYIQLHEIIRWAKELGLNGAYLKQQPLNLVEQYGSSAENRQSYREKKIPHSLNDPLWIVYQKFENRFGRCDIIILAWASVTKKIDGFLLFPPETLKNIGCSKDLKKGPPPPKFPEKFGVATSFRHRNLAGCIFYSPQIAEMQGWIWFYRSYYHTGGRVSIHRSEAPKVTYWTPSERDPEELEVNYDCN